MKDQIILLPMKVMDDRDRGNIVLALVNAGEVVHADRPLIVPMAAVKEAMVGAIDPVVVAVTAHAAMAVLEEQVKEAEAALAAVHQDRDPRLHEEAVQAAAKRLEEHADKVAAISFGVPGPGFREVESA